MRLTANFAWPFGWGATLAALIGGMVLSFLLFGFFLAWWLYADQDLTLAYQGLLYNSGLPQEYFDHTGYLSFLLIGNWYGLLHAIGLLPYHALADMPPPSDGPAAADAWQALVRAGRALSLLTAVCFTVIFAALLRRLTGNARVALMAATAFAFSGGIIFQARIMRTELLAGGLVVTGLLLLLLAATDQRTRWRPGLVGAGMACLVLAMENKIQALLPILALPVVIAALAAAVDRRAPHSPRSSWVAARWAWPVAIALVVLAMVLAVPAARLAARGLATVPVITYPVLPLAGAYPALVLLWFAGALAAFLAWRRAPLSESVATFAGAVAGGALALLVLLIRPNDQNIVALVRPVEHLAAFVAWKYAAPALSPSLIAAIPSGLGDVLLMHTIGLRLTRPTVIVEWLLVAAAIFAWRRGERRLPAAIALVLGAVIALETVFALRGLKAEYFVFTEPLVIVAAVLAWMRWAERLPPTTAAVLSTTAACVLAIVIIWGMLGSARLLFHHREPRHGANPDDVCQWAPFYLTRIERLPFCPAQACWDAGPFRTCWQDSSWRMPGHGSQGSQGSEGSR